MASSAHSGVSWRATAICIFLSAVGLASTPIGAWAEWRLNNERSTVAFVTVKAGDIAEAHRFGALGGGVGDDGTVSVEINLASVDTLIPIRDERMRELLFETARFPAATLSTRIDLPSLTTLAAGESRNLAIDGVLALKEVELPLRMEVVAARLSDNAMLVASRKPVIVYAASVGLVTAVERLREIAALPSISKAVPVNFVLVFERGVPRD